MAVYLTREFLADLKDPPDSRFVRQVLNHALTQDGEFVQDRHDHRYDGIEGAWIRYVSRGTTAYRLIFLRKGSDIYLFRAGRHSVEDHLCAPRSLDGAVAVSRMPDVRAPVVQAIPDDACLLKTTEAQFIGRHIEALYHVRHNEIGFVAPFVDLNLLESRHALGRFLDRAIEEGTLVAVVTSTDQTPERLADFKGLEERGISVFFLERLHTKMYLFDVDMTSRNYWQKGVQSQVIIGSSNLTNPGLGLNDAKTNEELNTRLSSTMLDEAKTYFARLIRLAHDYNSFAFKANRRKR